MKNAGIKILLAFVFIASGVRADVLFTEDFESPVVSGYAEGTSPDNGQWVRATEGFGGSRHGMINTNSGVFSTTPPNAQGYAFRYTNSGLTSQKDTVEVLYTGITYSASFDVVNDGSTSNYSAQLIAFTYNAARNDCRETPSGSIVLNTIAGVVNPDGIFETIQFSYTATSNDLAYLGYDIGIRFYGGSRAIIDNVVISNDVTGDVIPPLVQWQSPSDNSARVSDDASLIMIFHEDVLVGSGNITIKRVADGSTFEVIPAASASISSRTVTITPSSPFEHDTEYYVIMDAGVFVDGVGNPSRAISTSTDWNFTTVKADLAGILYQDSFESPVVSGSKKTTAPENWLRGTVQTSSGLANQNTGTFTTPYSNQAASVWHSSASLTLAEGVIAPEALVADQEYRLTFNVAKGTDLTGAYKVSMMAFTNGAVRTGADGVELASVSGAALSGSAAQEAVSLSYTAASTNAYLGQLMAVRIQGAGALVDNLTFSYTPPPPSGTVVIVK